MKFEIIFKPREGESQLYIFGDFKDAYLKAFHSEQSVTDTLESFFVYYDCGSVVSYNTKSYQPFYPVKAIILKEGKTLQDLPPVKKPALKGELTFKFISTSSHGYLEVSHDTFKEIMPTAEDKALISGFSSISRNFLYLEEDCDAWEFLKKCKLAQYHVDLNHEHSDNFKPAKNYSPNYFS